MCRFFLPSGTDKNVLVWWVLSNCACAIQKHWLRTTVQVIFIPMLYVLARMVFLQANLLRKKKRIGHNLVPTYKIFAASSLCTSQNKLKSKEKKARTT